MRLTSALAALAALALPAGCVPDTSREPVEIAVFGRGVDVVEAAFGDYQVTLLDARVAVGPLYFCSAAHASDELCATARLEVLEPLVIDLLDDAPQPGGVARGTTGRVSSAQFDLGRSFLHTRNAPVPTTAELDGHSALLVFAVSGPLRDFTVELALDLDPPRAGTPLVMGARTSADVTEDTASVTVRLDPIDLLGAVDLAQLEAAAEAQSELRPARGEQAFEAVAARLMEGRSQVFEWN